MARYCYQRRLKLSTTLAILGILQHAECTAEFTTPSTMSEESVAMDDDAMRRALRCGAEGSIGVFPNNPTGTLFRRDRFCLCPINSKCIGVDCELAINFVRNSFPDFNNQTQIESSTAYSVQAFNPFSCPSCTCQEQGVPVCLARTDNVVLC